MKFLYFAILMAAAFSVSAGELTVPITVDASRISFAAAGIYTRVIGTGMRLMGAEGEPSLPVFSARIALPTGCIATGIEIADAEYTSIRGRMTVIPAAAPQPFSVEREVYSVEPDPAIYGLTTAYPREPVSFDGSSVIMGRPVAYVSVYPVRWNPASGTAEVLTNLTLNVTYESSTEASTVIRRSLQSELRSQEIVRNSVVNPEAVSSSGAAIIDSRDLTYGEYVIICTSAYQSYAQNLADWKTSKGIPTNVYTTTYIQTNYSCYDLQQEIRAFLTDCRDEGVEYVLIYGDDNIIAGRDVKISAGGSQEYPPVDMYFADINDTSPGADLWDSNGNHVWGEYGVDNVDYHPDLWVGRASVNSTGECTIFNSKVYDYERIAASDYFETSPIEMRMGYSTGYLWDNYYTGDPMYASADAEAISNNYLPSGWGEAKCYESTGNNSSAITYAMINDGPHQIFHGSHGSETGMYTSYGSNYTVSQIMSQTNISSGNLPAIWNSFACLIGHLDGYECCGDAWLNSPNGGGFGAFNARFGWGDTTQPGQLSEAICLSFYDVMWNNDIYNLGVAHAMGGDELSPPADAYYDWCLKEYNLFGDPELPMWNVDAPNLSAAHPASISGAGNVTVTVTSGGSPVNGARVCIQKGNWQTGEVYEIGTTNSSGQVTLSVNPTTRGTMSVVAWAQDKVSYQGSINVTGVEIEEGENPVFINNAGSAYPSPAMSSATIPFSLAAAGNARVDVYDVTGRIVTTLAAEEMAAGQHTLVWNLEGANGSAIPSGVYHIRIATADWTGITSLVVAR